MFCTNNYKPIDYFIELSGIQAFLLNLQTIMLNRHKIFRGKVHYLNINDIWYETQFSIDHNFKV